MQGKSIPTFVRQRIVSLPDGTPWGEELLYRPEGSTTIGLLSAIGRVSEEAFRLFERSLFDAACATAPLNGKVTINVTPGTFLMLEPAQIPSSVVVELVEWGQEIPADEVAAHAAKLSDAGVDVWLDDFGAGDSGLLRCLSAGKWAGIKFDMAWKTIASDKVCATAQFLRDTVPGIVIVAEGIETETEATHANVWADLGQGYYFGRPA